MKERVQMTNEQIRERFRTYRKQNFEPSINKIAQYIDLSYAVLVRWNKGTYDYDHDYLGKIDKFLKERNY